MIEKIPFLDGYNALLILQNEDNKRLFDVILSNDEMELRKKIQIDNIEREKLELELISSGMVNIEPFKFFHT